MRPLGRLLAAVVAIWCVGLSGAADASGRAGPALPDINAPSFQRGAPVIAGRAAWHGAQATYAGGSRVLSEALRDLGSGKFTRLPGPWCADSLSAWLQRAGKPPLANRLAASALAYGPHVSNPKLGDLVVVATRRGYAGHVGVFVGFTPGGGVQIVSGNWSRRVAYGVVSRRSVTAFIRT